MTKTPTSTTVSADGTTIDYQSLGSGEGVIVVGGAMRTAEDYLPLASELAQRFQVHVLNRRSRGVGAAHGETCPIERDCEDLQALQAHTGATSVFGHSYGGLVVLETAKRSPEFTNIAVYEPGVSIDNSIPTAWIPRYRQMLSAGDTRGAFAYFVQHSGHAPTFVEKMPLWYLKAVMRLVIRKAQWQRMEPLLHANIIEHEQVIRFDNTVTSYGTITARVLLIGGSKSPSFITQPLHRLDDVLADSTVEILAGLDHNAPDERAPQGAQVRKSTWSSARPGIVFVATLMLFGLRRTGIILPTRALRERFSSRWRPVVV